jgi:hypothetical protein
MWAGPRVGRAQFPAVTVHYGIPLYFQQEQSPSHQRQQEVADGVLAAVRELHQSLAAADGPAGS